MLWLFHLRVNVCCCLLLRAPLRATVLVTQVYAWKNKMGSDSGKLLADAIKAHTNFEQIAQNMFDGEANVDMSKRGLDAGDAHIIAAALEKNDTVTQVHAWGNRIPEDTLTALMNSNDNVRNFGGNDTLELARCDMDSTDAKVLANLLKENTAVTQVSWLSM